MLCRCILVVQMFEFLYKHKAKIDRPNDIGMTPLHAACSGGHAMIVKYICDHDRSTVNSRDHRGRTPAYFAAQNGEVDILTFLIIYMADFDIPNIVGKWLSLNLRFLFMVALFNHRSIFKSCFSYLKFLFL